MDHTREHRSLLASAEKRLLIAIAGRLPRWLNSDHLTLLGLLSMPAAGLAFAAIGTTSWGAAALALALSRQLVRRQPRRHAREGPRSAAPALRLLRRSRDRSRGHGGAPRRHGRLRADGAVDRARRARRLLARLGGNLPGDAHGRRLPAVVRRHRPDGAADPARGRRLLRGGAPVGRRRRPSRPAARRQRARSPIAGLVLVFVASAIRNTRALYLAERLPMTPTGSARFLTIGLPRVSSLQLTRSGSADPSRLRLAVAAGDARVRRARGRAQLSLARALDLARPSGHDRRPLRQIPARQRPRVDRGQRRADGAVRRRARAAAGAGQRARGGGDERRELRRGGSMGVPPPRKACGSRSCCARPA